MDKVKRKSPWPELTPETKCIACGLPLTRDDRVRPARRARRNHRLGWIGSCCEAMKPGEAWLVAVRFSMPMRPELYIDGVQYSTEPSDSAWLN